MPRIHILDKAVAELVAAGEVVERPASIVKELVENAVDAGASSITVEIRGGGVRSICIQDNGCGMEREDIPRAFVRHATSKLRTADDLAGICTLGFRGEALASIAAVSRVEIVTKTAADAEGSVCRAEGGEVGEVSPAGRPVGTTVLVRDVFYNIPARMKFLKKDVSEGNAVAQVVDKCALSHPEIAFRFIRDGATKLRTSGSGDLLAVVRAVYGKELSDAMAPVDYAYENRIRVRGYVSRPEGAKPSRAYQNFFLNGRYVHIRTASAALQEAFQHKLTGGKHPACVLAIEMDAGMVDVNIHPAKIEVRFAEEKPVFHAVYFAVKSAIGAALGGALDRRKPEIAVGARARISEPAPVQQRMTAGEFRAVFGGEAQTESAARSFSGPEQPFSQPLPLSSARLDICVDDEPEPEPAAKSVFAPEQSFPQPVSLSGAGLDIRVEEEQEPSPLPAAESALCWEDVPPEAPDYRLIGEAFSTYILLEQGDDLVLVDKHAAHERILYEQLRENLSYGNRQVLLSPQAVTLPKEDYDAVILGLDRLEQMGFGVEDFGDGTVIVRETPIELAARDVGGIVAEIADRLRAGNRDLTPEALNRLYYSIACRGAVKGGEKTSALALEDVVEKLRRNPEITHCPHGRPVAVRITKREVEKRFGRLG